MTSAFAPAKYSEKTPEEMGNIFKEHYQQVFRTCLGILKNENLAADATQETFLHAWGSLSQFREASNIKTWLHRIAVNECLTILRNQARKPVEQFGEIETQDGILSMEDIIPAQSDQFDEYARKELGGHIKEALRELPLQLRQVIEARFIKDMSQQESAELFDISLAAAKTRAFRGLCAIRAYLKDVGY